MTADNYIIFNNLIIGQTANDHCAEVNRLGRRIELQRMRLIMLWLTMCLYARCKKFFFHIEQMKERKKAVSLSAEKRGGRAELLFPVPSVLLQHRK